MRRSQLGSHGVIHGDNDVNQHFARNLTLDYSMKRNVVLAKEAFSRKAVEDFVLNAYGEIDMAKETGMRGGKEHAVFVAHLSGRGNGCGGREGRGGRTRGKPSKGRT